MGKRKGSMKNLCVKRPEVQETIMHPEVVEKLRPEVVEMILRPELLAQILAFMPRDDNIRAGLVCHEWQTIVSSQTFSELCSRTVSLCSKICFPTLFEQGSGRLGLGLDMKQLKWHNLPTLPELSSHVTCLASDKGLLFLKSYPYKGTKEHWVVNPVTGAVRKLPSLSLLMEGDKQLAVDYKADLCSACLQVDEDRQSYTLLGVCKRSATAGPSLATGPARIVRYRSGSSSWTLLPSRCEGPYITPRSIDLTSCDICVGRYNVPRVACCAYSNGQVFGVARYKCPLYNRMSYFLISFHVEAMAWRCLCKLDDDFVTEPVDLVICNSFVMVVTVSKRNSPDGLPLLVVKRYDPAFKMMFWETEIPVVDKHYWFYFTCLAHGPLLCIVAMYPGYIATYNARTRKWHNSITKWKGKPWAMWEWKRKPWASLPAVFAYRDIVAPCVFELGLSTPV